MRICAHAVGRPSLGRSALPVLLSAAAIMPAAVVAPKWLVPAWRVVESSSPRKPCSINDAAWRIAADA